MQCMRAVLSRVARRRAVRSPARRRAKNLRRRALGGLGSAHGTPSGAVRRKKFTG